MKLVRLAAIAALFALGACSGSSNDTGTGSGSGTGSTGSSAGPTGGSSAGPTGGSSAGTSGSTGISNPTGGASGSGGSTGSQQGSSGGSTGASGACTDCSQGQSCGTDQQCAQVNASEAYCVSGCGTNNACPQGYGCGTLEDQNHNSLGNYCFPLPGTCSAVTTPGGSCETCSQTQACANGDPVCGISQFPDGGASDTGVCLDPCATTGTQCVTGYSCQNVQGYNACVPDQGTCP